MSPFHTPATDDFSDRLWAIIQHALDRGLLPVAIAVALVDAATIRIDIIRRQIAHKLFSPVGGAAQRSISRPKK